MPRRIFTNEEIDAMFQKVHICRKALHKILRDIGPPVHLKNEAVNEQWQRKVDANGAPTTGYCHRVTEAVYRMGVLPDGYNVHRKTDQSEPHWFFKNPDGDIIDLTADQFDDGYDYDGSRRRALPNVSCLARLIAERLGHPLKFP